MKQKFIQLIIGNSFNMFVTSVNGIYVARMIGVEQRGFMVLVLGLIGLFSTLFHFGTPHSAAYYVRNQPDSVGFILNLTILFQLLFFFVILGCLYLFKDGISSILLSDYNLDNIEIIIISFIVMVMMGNNILGPSIIAKGDIRSFAFGVNIGSISILILNIIYFNLELRYEVLLSLLIILFIGYSFTFILYVKTFLSYKIKNRIPGSLKLKEFFTFSWKSYIGALSVFSIKKVDIFIVGNLLGSFAVGLYSVAISLREIAMIIPRALTGLIGGELADNKVDINNKERLFKKSLKFTFVSMSISSVILFYSFDFIITILYGEQFKDAVILAKGIIWSSIPFTLAIFYGQAISSYGYPLKSSIVSLISAILTILILIIMIGSFKQLGLIISINISSIILLLVSFISYKRLKKGVV